MVRVESKKDVRRQVRQAQDEATREWMQRESVNREDIVTFRLAQQKLGAVAEWESQRREQIRAEATQRREEQRLEAARALARMRDRGEPVSRIAQLGGCSDSLVRNYLKEFYSVQQGSDTEGGVDSQPLGSDSDQTGNSSQRLGQQSEESPVPPVSGPEESETPTSVR